MLNFNNICKNQPHWLAVSTAAVVVAVHTAAAHAHTAHLRAALLLAHLLSTLLPALHPVDQFMSAIIRNYIS